MRECLELDDPDDNTVWHSILFHVGLHDRTMLAVRGSVDPRSPEDDYFIGRVMRAYVLMLMRGMFRGLSAHASVKESSAYSEAGRSDYNASFLRLRRSQEVSLWVLYCLAFMPEIVASVDGHARRPRLHADNFPDKKIK